MRCINHFQPALNGADQKAYGTSLRGRNPAYGGKAISLSDKGLNI